MKIAIAVLTWNRNVALNRFLVSCGPEIRERQATVAVFEDCGFRDNTRAWIENQRFIDYRPQLAANEYLHKDLPIHLFAGTANLGVAGNSNRALRWFLSTDCDYLLLCNDDIEFNGSVTAYPEAYGKTGLEFFCFGGIAGSDFKYVPMMCHGVELLSCSRITGALIALPRISVERLGYFDTRFGHFGEEHCDYTHRARLLGMLDIDGVPQISIDLKDPKVRHQQVESSLTTEERGKAVGAAESVMSTYSYLSAPLYRPYSLAHCPAANGVLHIGIGTDQLLGYKTVLTGEHSEARCLD